MRIDLKKDSERVLKYLARRAKEFPDYVNEGPGKDDDEIRLVTLGFSFDQAGWIALVFDTRPAAEFDGEWQAYIEENEEPLNGWFKAFSDMHENGSVLSLTQHDGTRRSFTSKSDLEVIAECFGAMCRNVLEQARETGMFDKLPLAEDCRLAVEEHAGNYGWIEDGTDGDRVDEDEVMNALRRAAKKGTKSKQIEYWIEQLDRMAAGKPCEAAKLVYCEDFVLGELSRIGKDAIVPLLKWANTWADKPEFKPAAQVKKDEECAYPNQNVLCYVFRALSEWGTALPEAEPLIQAYIRTAVKVKSVSHVSPLLKSKKPIELCGIVPSHAARVLHENYEGYPAPKTHASTNQLRNAERFTSDATPRPN